MLQSGRWPTPSFTPNPAPPSRKKSNVSNIQQTKLSDQELRERIFSNAAVLYPFANTHYEIVYGTRQPSENYAMLVRRTPSGEFAPLIRGTARSTDVLQSLLDITAAAIHKKLGAAQMPPLGVSEELPRYSREPTAAAQ